MKKYLAGGLTILTLAVSYAAFVSAQTSTPSSTPPVPPTHTQPMVVEINNSGHALLRGSVDAVGSGSLTVKSWGGDWTINVTADTKVYPTVTGNPLTDIVSFKTGDFVGVSGKVSNSQVWTIDATLIRDWSLRQTERQNVQGVRQVEKAGRQAGVGRIYNGTASSGISNNSFALTSGATSYTVDIDANTKLINRNWLSISVSDIQSGDKIRIFGTASSSTISAQVVRDMSLPR